VVSKSLRKTFTLKNKPWHERHEFKEDELNFENNFSNTHYSLLRERTNV